MGNAGRGTVESHDGRRQHAAAAEESPGVHRPLAGARHLHAGVRHRPGRPTAQLEALTDGAAGPGRTPHGNFVLSEITVTAAPRGRAGAGSGVKFARAEADFVQDGFPVADAIDGEQRPAGRWTPATGRRSPATPPRSSSTSPSLRAGHALDGQARPAVRPAAHARPLAAEPRRRPPPTPARSAGRSPDAAGRRWSRRSARWERERVGQGGALDRPPARRDAEQQAVP